MRDKKAVHFASPSAPSVASQSEATAGVYKMASQGHYKQVGAPIAITLVYPILCVHRIQARSL
jgi:hypothetical protein